MWPTGRICVSVDTEFHWKQEYSPWTKESGFFLLFLSLSWDQFFCFDLFYYFSRSKVVFWPFASYKCRWNSSLCQLHMCGVCVCNTISLRCRLVFVTPVFLKKWYSFNKNNRRTQTHILTQCISRVWHSICGNRLTVWTHKTPQEEYQQGRSVYVF